MKYSCPVCAFTGLDEPPEDFTICPSCGTEFDYHDLIRGHDELLSLWIATGPKWHSSIIPPPFNWNAMEQLRLGGLIDYSSEQGETQTEIGMVELGEGLTIVQYPEMPNVTVEFRTTEYGVGLLVRLLKGLRFASASV